MGDGVTSLGLLIWGADDEPGCVNPEPEVRHYRQLAWCVEVWTSSVVHTESVVWTDLAAMRRSLQCRPRESVMWTERVLPLGLIRTPSVTTLSSATETLAHGKSLVNVLAAE